MKIVCDACQAKYSISDDKVQGKVFKIRCKKCSNIIVVRGGAQASEAPAPAQEKDTRVYDYGYDGAGGAPADDAVWHLVINQDQVGPMTAGEVQQRFAAGEVDGETFAWREGFADWLPLAQVDAFAGLVASGSTTAALPGPGGGGGGAAAVASMFGGGDDGGTMRSDAGDLFASAAGGASHPHDDDGDLFGSKPAKSAGGGGAGAAQQKLRGERNENSVLFSLNNLAQLASDKPAPAAAAAPAGHATGAAGGEGSGLIDIRSMASAYLGGSGAAVGGAKPVAAGVGSIDDLPVFGGGGFSEPAVIVPTARASSNNKILYIMIGAVGLLAITAVIMVVMLLKGNKSSTSSKVAAADKGSAAASDKADSDKGSDKPAEAAEAGGSAEASAPAAGSDKPAEGSATQVATADKAEPAPAPAPAPAAHETHSAPAHHEVRHESHHVASAAPSPAPAPKPEGGGGCDEVSCVLNNYEGACCQKFRKGGHAAPSHGSSGNSDLPEELTRDMISSAIAAVKGRAMACGGRSSAKGLVKVHVRVGGDGRISSVSVSQTPDPSLGACVAAAVQRASFPKTQRGGSFAYPFPF